MEPMQQKLSELFAFGQAAKAKCQKLSPRLLLTVVISLLLALLLPLPRLLLLDGLCSQACRRRCGSSRQCGQEPLRLPQLPTLLL